GPRKYAARLRRVTSLQSVTQSVAEEPVAPVPLTPRVQWRHEQVGAVELAQDGGRPGVTEHRVAQRSRQSFEDGGPDQEIAVIGRQPVDDLGGEVVEDVAVVAAERRLLGTGCVGGQRSELQPGG